MASERSQNPPLQTSPHEVSTTLAAERASASNAIEIPRISLPQGGGALRGIDEQFSVNGANGTSALGLALPFTPGRNGFTPAMQLRYNSAAGNGPYGLGWALDYPVIQRRTDRRLPRYSASAPDVFTIPGADDLTPWLDEDSGWASAAPDTAGDYQIFRYRPRIESAFQRIERIVHPLRGEYWRVSSRDNRITIFGRSPEARLADPADPSRIFAWLPEFSFDDRGNWIQYVYKAENLDNVSVELHENGRRSGLAPFVNRYLKRLRYGNAEPYFCYRNRPMILQNRSKRTVFLKWYGITANTSRMRLLFPRLPPGRPGPMPFPTIGPDLNCAIGGSAGAFCSFTIFRRRPALSSPVWCAPSILPILRLLEMPAGLLRYPISPPLPRQVMPEAPTESTAGMCYLR